MKTPNTTQNQVLALVTAIIAQCVAFGIIDNTKAQGFISIAGIAIPLVWIIADSIIRNGRAKVAAAQTVAAVPPVGIPSDALLAAQLEARAQETPKPMAGGSREYDAVRESER
jgi:hypothetical protein